MKTVLVPLAKSILILLGLTAVASAKDARIHGKTLASEITQFQMKNGRYHKNS